jgi:type IV pilus assembly protein PilY1
MDTPNNLPSRSGARSVRFAALLAALLTTVPLAGRAVDLADQPLFRTTNVPGNVLLALSVEFPTALSPAYHGDYSTASTYIGYFDPEKCYRYIYSPSKPEDSYFAPDSKSSGHACASSSSRALWSGNFLNWASMGGLDAFRKGMTGGHRAVDTTTSTILEKTYNFNSGAQTPGNAPDKTIADSNLIRGATPFDWASATTKVWHQGTAMLITGKNVIRGTADMDTTCPKDVVCVDVGSPSKPFQPLTPDNKTSLYYDAQSSAAGTADEAKVYKIYIRVKVCDPSVGVEPNCTAYGSNYKPEGLMQAYSSKLRFSAFGYLNVPDYDKKKQRDGGVMRARMKYVGPNKTVPGSTPIANPNAEWDADTGVFVVNPDGTDAKDTVSTFGLSSGAVPNSGVVNYLNKFGNKSGGSLGDYKSFDPVSELYYAGLRYYKKAGNLKSYTDGTDDKNADGFPVITNWDDPIVYSCQKNFILGIGDVNTHTDRNFEGATGRTVYEDPIPAPTITSKDVTEATNMVGTLEGIPDLAAIAPNKDKSNSFYIAGLAYDAHTVDIRPDIQDKQTISTYWLDVWEYETYKDKTKNMYWLAAKYGGFTPPEGFSPYSKQNSSSTLKDDDWYTNNEVLAGIDKRPDNYFAASRADNMIQGLQAAFEKIASEAIPVPSTALSTASPNFATDGTVSYSASYNVGNWTGQVTAAKVTFDRDGTPTTTPKWYAQALLDARDVKERKIVTCCTSAGAGLPFTLSSLSGATLSSRTNYSTFANVPGVTSTPDSVANYIKYLRGDRAQELKNSGAYRNREHLLGDIIDSKPVAIGVPAFPYHDNFNPGYTAFKNANNKRKTVVYVGANDGMLHAFDGSIDQPTSGQELFAYVPSFVYGDSKTAGTSGLASLGKAAYSHHYFVDSTPDYVDVDFSRTKGATKQDPDWRTLLIGGLGKGGKGYYAIDVTNPDSWTSEADVASKVLWEFTDPRMGYSYGRPSVVKTKKYGWVVLFTSGYNNSDGVGYFFFVNPRNGELLEAVATPKGSVASPLNIGEHTAFVPDYSDMTTDAVYAGDLMGNVWRLDLTGNGDYGPPVAIASLTNTLRETQPVTVRPLVEVDPSSKKRYVLIGTGKLLADSDMRNSSVQSFYAIVDGTGAYGQFYTKSTLPTGVSFPIDSRTLEPNKDLIQGIGSKPTSPMGWYFDLPTSNNIAQRVNVTPTANRGIVAFVANLPDGEVCKPAGTGTVYAANFTDGQTVLVGSDGRALASTTPIIGSILTELAINRANGKLRLYVGGGDSGGTPVIGKVPANLSTATGLKQLTWRGVTTAD